MSRNRRALLLGISIVIPAWLGLRAIPESVSGIAQREEAIVQHLELLARYREVLESLPQLEDSINAMHGIASALPHTLLVGPDDRTAAVDLMRRTREVMHARPATLVEFEDRRVEETAGPLALAVLSATIEADLIELLRIVSHIEQDPALAIESFDIRAADPHVGDSVPERLMAELVISGWYRPAPGDSVQPLGHALAARP